MEQKGMKSVDILLTVYAEEAKLARQLDCVRIAVATVLIVSLGIASIYFLNLPSNIGNWAFGSSIALAIYSGIMIFIVRLYNRLYMETWKIARQIRKRATEANQGADFVLTADWLVEEILEAQAVGRQEANEKWYGVMPLVVIFGMGVPLALMVVTAAKLST
jgi:hypothetical protein